VKSLFTLIPDRYLHEHFWRTIARRNRWLIKLRYGAFVLLFILSAGLLILNQISDTFHFQSSPLLLISIIILIYNLLFSKIGKKLDDRRSRISKQRLFDNQYKFHDLHFSLLQITADFISLLFFIHFTGGVETPLFVFFIFHVIIGSLILPGPVIYLIVTCTFIITAGSAYFEFIGLIPHYSLNLLPFELYNNSTYLFIFFATFGIGLYLSTYLANSIAKELYTRENRLANTLEELAEAEKTKSRYVMTIVHDLKTPIAAASTYLNMILDGNMGELSETLKKPLERSKIRLAGAINTINDILHISQLKAESSIEDIELVDIVELFNEIYEDMRILIVNKELKYKLDFDTGKTVNIQSEPKLLKLAMANLVSNSVKYTDNGGSIVIEIRDGQEYAVINVIDNGIGIPDEDRDKMFTNFYRSRLSKSKGIEGTGLGLSFVKEVIERYNGSISLLSPSSIGDDTRPGTEFIIKLPKIFSAI